MKTTLILLAAGVSVVCGCITHEETVYRDVNRVRVSFENDAACRLFYETLSTMATAHHEESKTEVSIPVVFENKRRVVSGGNEPFNAAVRECDTDQNSTITEQEARIFAARRGKS